MNSIRRRVVFGLGLVLVVTGWAAAIAYIHGGSGLGPDPLPMQCRAERQAGFWFPQQVETELKKACAGEPEQRDK